MKQTLILLLFLFTLFCAYSQQEDLSTAHRCYEQGDYECARKNFASYLRKQPDDVDVKALSDKARDCANYKIAADDAFSGKNYEEAAINYSEILIRNPSDTFAKSQLEECQGKPTESPIKQATTLSVSMENVSFNIVGGKKNISVDTNASSYNISLLPSWCTVSKYSDWFVLTCKPNHGSPKRNSWFRVTAGDKEVRVVVQQSGVTTSTKTNTNSQNRNNSNSYSRNTNSTSSTTCFNCPQTKYPWGISLGYVDKPIYPYYFMDFDNLPGIQIGIKYEPLFKYGFGLHTGLYYESYFQTVEKSYDEYYYDDTIYNGDYIQHVFNIPLHLEYRLNFHKNFGLFVYGGASLDWIVSNDFGDTGENVLLDFGGGLRINHVQFNVGKSCLIGNGNHFQDFSSVLNRTYKNLTLSMSYMF